MFSIVTGQSYARLAAAIALVASLLLLGARPASAVAAGAGPDTALAPNGGWTPLAVGQRVWYAFQYAGDNSQILVDMAADPGNGATFSVWSPANLTAWAAGQGEHPVGHGASDSYVNGGDTVWQGSFNTPGTYYVVVDQPRATPAGGLVNVIGSGIGGGTSVSSNPVGQTGGR